MGLSPRDVDRMTLWEMDAAVAGWNAAHGGEQPIDPMSEAEFDDLLDRNASWIAAHRGGL